MLCLRSRSVQMSGSCWCLTGGLAALAIATMLASAAWLLPDRVDARVMSGIREQVVWQPDSPEPVAGERIDEPPAPSGVAAWPRRTQDRQLSSRVARACLQPASEGMWTHGLPPCTLATAFSTLPTWRRCGRARGLPW